jgi:predicted RNase H-like HicB family nuclease
MKRQFNVIIERDSDGWYIGTVPELKGCHTQAKSLDTLMKRIREAVEVSLEDNGHPVTNEFVGVQRLTIEA